ncbi:sensor of ECF-type sigma factor [Winogradskyella sp. SYSU M77433]|uniref:sensor of ECF-type sigma factor n=1 Tax=Winogradskyella sp. SYSU M77433 TaxID=3042722 RepID=UPI00248055F3|nr:sensor of ECF-type sigma factor [Winogradskyella sp. SYSU M77433]MDH7914155.1 sensor of ECF-type sigma factor [Winogradskyella sp. SYSU M77433]
MKKLIPLLLLFISFSSFAQRNGIIKERIKAQKVAFITEQLSLTSEEAQGFWPIYNEFEETTDKIRSQELRSIKMQLRRNPDLSDKEADELLKKLMKAESDMHTAKLKLVTDLKSVISAKKIIKLKAAEDEFNRKLLDRLKEFRDKRNRR